MADSPELKPLRTALIWGVCLAGSVNACVAIAPARSPNTTVAAYARALRNNDAAAAYALLSPGDRKALSEAEFARTLRENRAEADELATRLEHAAAPRVVASVQLDDGSQVELERLERGGFRLVDPLTRFYSQASPRAALESFVRAVERSRWDVVLALMPNADREGLDAARLAASLMPRREELTRLVALLSAERDRPIEVIGDRATMPYAESFTVRFVREDELWKIEDPE